MVQRFKIASFITSDRKVLEFEIERTEKMYITMCLVGFILLALSFVFLR